MVFGKALLGTEQEIGAFIRHRLRLGDVCTLWAELRCGLAIDGRRGVAGLRDSSYKCPGYLIFHRYYLISSHVPCALAVLMTVILLTSTVPLMITQTQL